MANKDAVEEMASAIVQSSSAIASLHAETAAGLAIIRALYLLAERAQRNGTTALTSADLLAVARQVADELDAKIANTKDRTNG